MRSIKNATFGGVADGVGLDVDGPIGTLIFERGLGNPSGVPTAVTEPTGSSGAQLLPATMYGYTEGSTGYPAAGDLGGVVSATSIHKLVVGSANSFTQTCRIPNWSRVASKASPTTRRPRATP